MVVVDLPDAVFLRNCRCWIHTCFGGSVRKRALDSDAILNVGLWIGKFVIGTLNLSHFEEGSALIREEEGTLCDLRGCN